MSETVTMTLTEFLLARIAEDEERVQVATEINWDGPPSFYDTEGAHRDDWNLWTFHVNPGPHPRGVCGQAAHRGVVPCGP